MSLITVDFWGKLACFTNPGLKAERYSYEVPTPSALRGALSSIYEKPKEFYWAIRKIEVMKPIKYVDIKRNEVNRCMSRTMSSLIVDSSSRVQRTTHALYDVRYRVTAEIIPAVNGYRKPYQSLVDQALRRIEKGQCFRPPYLGQSEFVAYFELSKGEGKPIPVSKDLGLMVYDTFVPYDNRVSAPSSVSMYHAVMENGTIIVPDYDSDAVLKPKNAAEISEEIYPGGVLVV